MKKPIAKILLLFILSGCTLNGYSQTTKTSIANGDWFDPTIWSPAGVPTPLLLTDSLIVNTQVTFNQTLIAWGVANGSFRINPGGSLTGDSLFMGVTNSFYNYGKISVNFLEITGNNTLTHNFGHINAGYFIQAGDFYNEPGAFITGAHLTTAMPTPGEIFTNKPGGIIALTDTLVSWVGMLVNNGDITTANWINTDVIGGTTGKFCVANCFMNTGNITGTVDICDATPNNFPCDLNMGTIASSVTYCTKGPCAPATVSVNELMNGMTVEVYPNPSTGKFNLVIPHETKQCQIEIYNISGEKIVSQQTINEKPEIDISSQPNGIYFLKIHSVDQSYTQKLIISRSR